MAAGRLDAPSLEPADEPALIVVVDDEPLNVILLERIVERSGLGRAVGFTDPAAAVEAIRAREPDLILLDVHMPGIDGFGVLEAIRAGLPSDAYLPVVFLTGDLDRATRTRALAAGARDFLTKPFDVDEVVLRCQNLLETRRLHGELRDRNALLLAEVRDRTRQLEAARHERLAVANALARPRSAASPEDAARMLCGELCAYDGVAGAAIVVFGPGSRASALAVAGATGEPLPIGRNLPASRAMALRTRAATGPWTEEPSATPDPTAIDGDRAATPARIVAPVHAGRQIVGVLVVASNEPVDAARLGTLLPTTIEYANLAGALLGPDLLHRQRDVDLRRAVESILRRRAFAPVFQPIVDLESGRTRGHEALTRFADGERPERRFADAEAVGLGVDLELACLDVALEESAGLTDGWVSLNVSPDVVLARDRLARALRRARRPVVLEITEHLPVTDYRAVREAIARLDDGVELAIDDAGAGYSSFRHIVELGPQFVKLDVNLVRGIDRDPVRQALVSGMDFFALKTGCRLIAEGIETAGERDMVRSLSVELGQGFLLGPPAGMPA
jgi:EAL domain-containing protein (putative c-di-GMP-specific phosphodiesterase class I)/DNA-binding response OmpR family regulator